jgi:hypothetical protein
MLTSPEVGFGEIEREIAGRAGTETDAELPKHVSNLFPVRKERNSESYESRIELHKLLINKIRV